MVSIDALTIGEAKQLAAMFGGNQGGGIAVGIGFGVGKMVIIRTYTAGVWFGTLAQKAGNEVILENARRMWRWHAKDGICLSACATNGIERDRSRISAPIDSIWLEAIEIIPCTDAASDSIGGSSNAIPE